MASGTQPRRRGVFLLCARVNPRLELYATNFLLAGDIHAKAGCALRTVERKVGVIRIGWIVAFMGLLAGPDDDRAFAQRAAAPGSKRTTISSKASLEGEWSGTLQAGEAQLHLVLHLSKDAKGEWHGEGGSL